MVLVSMLMGFVFFLIIVCLPLFHKSILDKNIIFPENKTVVSITALSTEPDINSSEEFVWNIRKGRPKKSYAKSRAELRGSAEIN